MVALIIARVTVGQPKNFLGAEDGWMLTFANPGPNAPAGGLTANRNRKACFPNTAHRAGTPIASVHRSRMLAFSHSLFWVNIGHGCEADRSSEINRNRNAHLQ